MKLKTSWELVTDSVMGGVSKGELNTLEIAGLQATQLSGKVSLDNNGGFLQMAFNINSDASAFDASCFMGLELEVYGNAEIYDVRIRTSDLNRSWQSYRASFFAPSHWKTIQIPFLEFKPNKTTIPLNISSLRRIGILAIGSVLSVNISVAMIRFVKQCG